MSLEQTFLTFVVLVALVLFLRWDVSRHPHVKCGRCNGSGRHFSLVQARWGDCRRCGGTGKRRGFLPWLFGVGRGK